MKKVFKKLVPLCLASILFSCGAIEKSSYKGTASPDTDGNPNTNGSTQSKSSNDTKKDTSGKLKITKAPVLKDDDVVASERDATFDSGLDSCVKLGLAANGVNPFTPMTLVKTDTEWAASVGEISATNFWTVYDSVLRTLVSADEGLVTYSRLRAGGDLETVWAAILKSLSITNLPGTDQSDAAKIAFWVNTYNLIMIDILRADPSALSTLKRSETFKRITRKVGNVDTTLDQIEYGVFRLGGRTLESGIPSAAVPSGIETRLHTALVCGAKSCPKLRNFAYEDSQLDKILSENVHMFVNNQSKHLKWDIALQQPKFSALFGWFSGDFDLFASGTKPQDISRFLLTQCRTDITEIKSFLGSLSSFSKLAAANKLAYDWSVNER